MSPKQARTTPAKFLLALRRELARVADPKKAPEMRAYMKSAMPYHGVPGPVQREVWKRVLPTADLSEEKAWRSLVLALWRGAKFREERYAAIALASDRRAQPFQTLDALPVYEEMIVTGAWWDYVDFLAKHRVGELLGKFPAPMKKTMLAWSRSDDTWKRRTSILCQLGFKREIDLDLLYACMEPSMESKEFFLRKAIGWALREHAWLDPREVVRFVRDNESRLSGLSKREALKNVPARLLAGTGLERSLRR